MTARIRIADIAREAGVSVPTVSKVLNGHESVSAETRARIEDLLRRHRYVRRGTVPEGRRRARVRLLDLVINEIDSQWSIEIIRGVEEAAKQGRSGLVVSAVHGREDDMRRWLDNVQVRRSDGAVLVVTELAAKLRGELRTLDVPLVLVDPVGEPDHEIPSIGVTNWTGAREATEHLLSLGHRRIGLLGGPAEVLCSRARADGYRAALTRAGVPLRPEFERHGEFHHESGYVQTNALLNLDDPPTALFACSDEQALGAYTALHRRGLRVPDDVSVVGFDDLPLAAWVTPSLTTVRQPLAEMAGRATRDLLRRIAGEPQQSLHVEMATTLVLRESTGSPRTDRAR